MRNRTIIRLMDLFLALTVMGSANILAADSGGGGSECFWADSNTESGDSNSSSEKRLVCRVASLLNRPQALPQVRSEATSGPLCFPP
jgi:hypothetical protein